MVRGRKLKEILPQIMLVAVWVRSMLSKKLSIDHAQTNYQIEILLNLRYSNESDRGSIKQTRKITSIYL